MAHVTHLVKLLTYVSQRNAGARDDTRTLFHGHPDREESLLSFITRLDDNIRCSESCYATALVFIDRITEMCPDLTLNRATVHRLFSTSLLIANQFLDDTAERTLQFSRVTGYDTMVMVALKTDFLFRIKFRLCTRPADVRGYSDKLQGRFSTAAFEAAGLWAANPTPTPMAVIPTSPETNAVIMRERPKSMPHRNAEAKACPTRGSSAVHTRRTLFTRKSSKNFKMTRALTDGDMSQDTKKPQAVGRKLRQNAENFVTEFAGFGLDSLIIPTPFRSRGE